MSAFDTQLGTLRLPSFPEYTRDELFLDSAKRRELVNWMRLNMVSVAEVERTAHLQGIQSREQMLELFAITLARELVTLRNKLQREVVMGHMRFLELAR